MYGLPRLVADLRALGHAAEPAAAPDGSPFVVITGFVVPVGRFAGRMIDLAIPATSDFPISVASALHVRAAPQLYDCGDTVPNVRNINASPFGEDWRYWSHTFGSPGDRSARRLMSQINGIFLNAA